jgi:hypothetical protein
MRAPEEDIDGVVCPHTQFDEDTPMDFDGHPTTDLAPQVSAGDENMDNVPASPAQLPNRVGHAAVIPAAQTQNIEIVEAPIPNHVTPPTTSALPEPPEVSAVTFPSGRKIWKAIPPIGILTRDLVRNFLGRLPNGARLDAIIFMDAVRRCTFGDAGDQHWYPKRWLDVEKDEVARQKMPDDKTREIPANGAWTQV